jgi:16S rRNA (guanine1207-N2)-methyltransferase
MQAWDYELYFKKRIAYALNKQRFQFDTAELLFSTHDIDLGTQFLLRRMLGELASPRSMLDLGCGYGVIGIVLARFFPDARVLLVDKDLLAVFFSLHNAEVNTCANVTAQGSIGVDDIPAQTFDLIVSNIPGHIGERAIEEDFIRKPVERLSPGGSYWMVVVTPLDALLQSLALPEGLALAQVATRPGHSIYTITRPVTASEDA